MPVLFAIFVLFDVLLTVQWSRTFYLVYRSGGDFLFVGQAGFAFANLFALMTDLVFFVTSLLSIYFFWRGDVAWRVIALIAMVTAMVSALSTLAFSLRFGMSWWAWGITLGSLVYPWFFFRRVGRGALA
jgi:hypothetical protein